MKPRSPLLAGRGHRLNGKVLRRRHGGEGQEGNDSKMQGARLISISDLKFFDREAGSRHIRFRSTSGKSQHRITLSAAHHKRNATRPLEGSRTLGGVMLCHLPIFSPLSPRNPPRDSLRYLPNCLPIIIPTCASRDRFFN